jgi:hypothetical protein
MVAPVLITPSELAAAAWIDSIPGFPQGAVGTQLPADETSWAETGFVTVAVVGGSPDPWQPVRKPVVQVECWATNPGSNKPPWFMASSLAEQIRASTYDQRVFGRELHPESNGVVYPTARALSAYPLTEPHRVYGDAGDYAGYSFDLRFSWVQIDR